MRKGKREINRVILNIIRGIVYMNTDEIHILVDMISRILRLEFPYIDMYKDEDFCETILNLILYAECNLAVYVKYKNNDLFRVLYRLRYDYCQTLCSLID